MDVYLTNTHCLIQIMRSYLTNLFKQVIIWLGLVLSFLWYVVSRWRALCSGYTPFFALCETIVLLVGVINMYILMDGSRRYISKSKEIGARFLTESETTWYHYSLPPNHLPTVLIIIPIYHEGIVLLERTLLAVNQIVYPKHLLNVVIGDDSHDDGVRRFLEEKFPTMIYHRRERILGDAKAGNLNDILWAGIPPDYPYAECPNYAALEPNLRYKGEFVLILDCDMAPISDILSRLVPMFYDPDRGFAKDDTCGFIQSPQAFCNIHGIDFLGQHYNFFYKVVLPAYSGFSLGVPCCGTNVLFDRYHLTRIGGIQLGSITEDFNTSLTLHSIGVRSKFSPFTTAVGLAPTTLLDFYHQRERWSIGGLQIVFSTQYWSRLRRLPWVYKWIYTFSGASPILSFFLLILLFGPIMDLFNKDIFLCGMSDTDYMIHFSPYMITYCICLLFLHRGLSWPIFILSVQESIFMIPFFIIFFITFVLRSLGWKKISFRITPKRAIPMHTVDVCTTDLWILLPYLAYFGLAITSIVTAVYRHSLIRIDIAWLIFIGLQLLNPICFAMQNIFSGA